MPKTCPHKLKFSLEKSTARRPICNQCRRRNIQNDRKGFQFCVPCDYDRCYDCTMKILEEKGNAKKIMDEIQKKGKKMVGKKAVQKVAQRIVGGSVPGIGDAVMMHINTIEAAAKGDHKGVISGALTGFGAMSGAVIGTAVLPGVGTIVGSTVGSGLGYLGGLAANLLF